MTPSSPSTIRNVLIIEDNPGDARLIRELLREALPVGHEVEHAEDLASGRARIHSKPFDVALLDLSLPDSHGTETVATLRTAAPQLPIVVLTGLEREEVAYEALEKGAQDYLVKGKFDVPVLTRTLRYAVQRKRLEEQLKSSISLLQATLESTADGILVVDRLGQARNYNRRFAEMWALAEAKPDGAGLIDHLFSKLVDPERLRVRLATPPEDDEQTYDLLELTDGRIFEGLSVPNRLDTEVLGQVWSFRDVTERRRAIDELRQARLAAESANRAKSEFLADLSHEIRTPLNTVIGAADLLSETSLAGAQREYVDILRRSAQALLALVNDVLDLSKIEAGGLDLERIPFSLDQLVTGVIELLRASAAQKGLSLRADIPPDIGAVPVIGDPNRLQQILINLASNAIKFTPQGGVTIAVVREPDSSFYRFSVSDTGIGIPGDHLSSIFENFRQLDASVARLYGGTGLGLGIARKLVELMRGRIWVESEVGRGSRFHFTVQLERAPIRVDTGSVASPSAATSDHRQSARILLADDSEDNRMLVGFYLKGSPYELDMADNGEVAFRKFQAGSYDLVIMDLQMPVLDGYQAVRKIRRWETEQDRPPTPIIALTAYAIDEKFERSLEGGCSGFLTKPIKRDRLLSAIRTYIAS